MLINDFYESYVITKNYESRKKFRFLLELNEMPSNAISLRITFINKKRAFVATEDRHLWAISKIAVLT